jgi:hypothetical protein
MKSQENIGGSMGLFRTRIQITLRAMLSLRSPLRDVRALHFALSVTSPHLGYYRTRGLINRESTVTAAEDS